MRHPFIGVVGAGACSGELEKLAAEVGREIARHDAVLVCGGLGGVMAAAARGAKEVGAHTVGILPGPDPCDANPYIDFPIATNMGHARNAVIVQTSHVLIAIAGGHGTLSEIALALKTGKGVVAMACPFSIPGLTVVQEPLEAVRTALSMVKAGPAQ